MFAQMGALGGGQASEGHARTYHESQSSLFHSDDEEDQCAHQQNNDKNIDLVGSEYLTESDSDRDSEGCENKEKSCDGKRKSQRKRHSCQNGHCRRIAFNVSGRVFETQAGTLNRYPTTKLGSAKKRSEFWDEGLGMFFLDRHAPSFQALLYYFQSGGRLYRPEEIPEDIFMRELEFYELEPRIVREFKLMSGFLPDPVLRMPEHPTKQLIWKTFENPGSSPCAKVLGIFSLLAILASIVNFCLESLPDFKDELCSNVTTVVMKTSTEDVDLYSEDNGTGTLNMTEKIEWHETQNYSSPFFVVECLCVGWFTIELVLRFASCPRPKMFLRNIMNLFDVGAVLPFYVILVVVLLTGACDHSQKSSLSIVFLRVLRLFRAFRIFKLTKHSRGMQILGLTIRHSMRELGLFLVFIMICVVLFSAAIYYADQYDTNSQNIHSIPDAFWWTIITMTTVGYGDVVPQGLVGKLVGTGCLLSGIITIALLLPVVVVNFARYYVHERKKSN